MFPFFFPDWASRCKQIMKIWRKVSAADKVPYLVGLFWGRNITGSI